MNASQRGQLQGAMTALAAGDRSAYHLVFSMLWPILESFCQRSLHDSERGRDAAQSALIKLFLHATDYRAGHDVVAWALGFASYECLSARNRSRRGREDVDEALLATLTAGAQSPEDAAIQIELHAAAIELVGTLSPADADTLGLAFSGERSRGADAAARKRLQRALGRLRAAWRHTYGSDD